MDQDIKKQKERCKHACVNVVALFLILFMFTHVTFASANQQQFVNKLNSAAMRSRQVELKDHVMPERHPPFVLSINDIPLNEMADDIAKTWEIRRSGIPLYNQRDYPDVPYSQGSVATSGCGITCLAMVAAHLYERDFSHRLQDIEKEIERERAKEKDVSQENNKEGIVKD